MSTPPVSKPKDDPPAPTAKGLGEFPEPKSHGAESGPDLVLGALGGLAPQVAAQTAPDAALLAAMAAARAQADKAAAMGEVPVGAVVLFEGRTIAAAHNRREIDHDPLAHAEMLALHQASQILGRWRLTGCTLVVTLEPCPMCAGAIVNSRIDHVVFGAWDARAGAVGSVCNIVTDSRLNHRARVTAGVESDAARAQLQHFFAARRHDKKRSGL